MRTRLFAVSAALMAACNAKQPPYLKHNLAKAEKLAGGCEAYAATFKMESTLIGERYEFQKCLPPACDGRYTAQRHGDTVDLRFAAADGPKALYTVVMDIDAYPPYRFLTVDGTIFAIIPTQN